MRYEVPAELDGERVDRVVAVLADLSRSKAREIVDAGGVIGSGDDPMGPSDRVSTGDTLEFEIPEAAPLLEPHPVEYATVHIDDHVIVISKPAGLTVHPGAGTDTETLAAGLLFDHPELEGVGQEGRWGIVHRLDRATSGLLVVARTQEAYERLSEMMRARDVGRAYIALTQGLMSIPRGTIDAPIGADPHRATKRALSPTGKRAVTHYRRRDQWSGPGVSMVDVTLETGRTHQIRVHLAAIGHPVLGDRLYGGRDPIPVPRLALHAATLRFHHPVDGSELSFAEPLPDDLVEVVESLGEPDDA